MKTHIFPLNSGPECEITELTGNEQKLLTEQKSKKIGDALDEVLLAIVKRIGTRTSFDMPFFQKMISPDKKVILENLRGFSTDWDPKFVFKFEYEGSDGKPAEIEMDLDVSERFAQLPPKVYNPDKNNGTDDNGNDLPLGGFDAICVQEYSEMDAYREYEIVLNRTNKRVRLTLLDGNGERIGAMTKRDNRSTHTPIIMRNPREITKTASGNELPLVLNLDKLPFLDIEQIRVAIKAREGQVDSEFKFLHPNEESRPEGNKYVGVDLLQQMAFFFPSQAI